MIKLIIFLIVCLCLSACSFDNGYIIENGNVYFQKPNIKDFQYKKERIKIENADAKTFKILKDGYYAKDNKAVFCEATVINEADPNTFKALSNLIGKDNNSGFFKEKKISNSDGLSFQVITSPYSKDKNNIYYEDKRIVGADINSFEITEQKSFISKDKNAYYNYEIKLQIKDPKTFTQLKDDFWKDKYYVYDISNIYNPKGIILVGVDAESAKVIGLRIIKDKFGCHNGYERVKCDE